MSVGRVVRARPDSGAMRLLTRSPARIPARPPAGTRRTALGCALAAGLVPAVLLSATSVSATAAPLPGGAHPTHGTHLPGDLPARATGAGDSRAGAVCPAPYRGPSGRPTEPGHGGGQAARVRPADEGRPPCGDPTTGEVLIRATDGTSGDPLPGAAFELWRETNGVTGLQTAGAGADLRVGTGCTTGEDGVCARTVRPGTYYWRETAAPDGYDLPSPGVFGPALLTDDNAATGVQLSAPGTPTPPPVSGTLRLEDTDADSGLPVRGARFEVWRETNRVAGLQTDGTDPDTRVGPGCVTDASGSCGFPGLAPGSYHLRETGVPEGYRLPADPVSGPHVLMAHEAAQDVTVRLHDSRDARGKSAHRG